MFAREASNMAKLANLVEHDQARVGYARSLLGIQKMDIGNSPTFYEKINANNPARGKYSPQAKMQKSDSCREMTLSNNGGKPETHEISVRSTSPITSDIMSNPSSPSCIKASFNYPKETHRRYVVSSTPVRQEFQALDKLNAL